MRFIDINVHADGSVRIHGLDQLLVIGNDTEQVVRVNDRRTLTDTAQYNIGWHDGYRANHNDAAVAAAYLEIDKRMVASLKPAKDSIGE